MRDPLSKICDRYETKQGRPDWGRLAGAEADASWTAETLAQVAARYGVPIGAVAAVLRHRMSASRADSKPMIVIRAGAVVVP